MIKLIRILQEIDFHSKLSRAHSPDYYELGSADFKPFDEDMEENVAPNHDGKSAPYGSGYKTFDEELEENFEDSKNPGATQEQWGYARVNAFLEKTKYVKTYESFHGELIAKSQYHSVYQDPKNRDRVIKTGDTAIEHGKLFQKFPKYCPIVYEIHEAAIPTENYIVIEKLETDKATRDFEKLINQDRGYIHNWGYNTFKNNKSYQEVKDRLTTDDGRKMLDQVRDIVLAIGMKDIHARNFGYDKQGNLKALDI